MHNGSMLGVMRVLEKTGLHKLFAAKYSQVKQTLVLPTDLYPKRPRLLVAGSDAHRPDCLGACVEITGNASTRDAVFGCISRSRGKVIMQSRSSVIKDMGVVCKEWLLKQMI
ncbi:MAG TPA: hypothetical protein VJH22_02785 [Candidatus Nanoarchaeia archaeon]|nr:hypothetical protein [Candidatus Nanoarchaeia archaeon]